VIEKVAVKAAAAAFTVGRRTAAGGFAGPFLPPLVVHAKPRRM
jgi:hypothetical protein